MNHRRYTGYIRVISLALCVMLTLTGCQYFPSTSPVDEWSYHFSLPDLDDSHHVADHSSGTDSSAGSSQETGVDVIEASSDLTSYTGTSVEFLASADHQTFLQNWTSARLQAQMIRSEQEAYYRQVLPVLLAGEGNQVSSPLCAYFGLVTLLQVTSGNTRSQIRGVLGEKVEPQDAGTVQLLWKANEADTPVLTEKPASSLWLSDAYTYEKDTLTPLADFFHTSIYQGEMGSAAMNEAYAAYVKEHAPSLSPVQTASLNLPEGTQLCQLTSLDYRCVWEYPFDPEYTTMRPFSGIRDGESVTQDVPMMIRAGLYSFVQSDAYTAVLVPLLESGSLILILPAPDTTPESLLDNEDVISLILQGPDDPSLVSGEIRVEVPRFTISSQNNLLTFYRELGVPEIMNPNLADFSALSSDGLYLSKAEQDVAITLDERGLCVPEGEAGLPAAENADSSEIPVFSFDRPFLFAVTGGDGSVLLSGTVYEISS